MSSLPRYDGAISAKSKRVSEPLKLLKSEKSLMPNTRGLSGPGAVTRIEYRLRPPSSPVVPVSSSSWI